MVGSEIISNGIRVTVNSEYSPSQSQPENNNWLYIYTITISSERHDTVQLLNRHWTITNGDGKTQVVQGPGVVGKQPVLAPGQSFSYSSACPLDTEYGCMHGFYTFADKEGDTFSADIAPFSLAQAELVH